MAGIRGNAMSFLLRSAVIPAAIWGGPREFFGTRLVLQNRRFEYFKKPIKNIMFTHFISFQFQDRIITPPRLNPFFAS